MSKKLKLTPLFPLSIKPARVGVYQHKFKNDRCTYFSRWNGKYWCGNRNLLSEAGSVEDKSHAAYGTAFVGWRGLAVKHG